MLEQLPAVVMGLRPTDSRQPELISLNLLCKGEEEGSSRELWRRLKSANTHAQMKLYGI